MAEPVPPEIDPETLNRWRQDGRPVVVLDVREPWEVALCALENSLQVPLAQLPQRTAELTKEQPLVVLCHFGGRSRSATAWLRAQGWANATNLTGGIDAWAQQVDPDMARY